jgi:hypothetical protein
VALCFGNLGFVLGWCFEGSVDDGLFLGWRFFVLLLVGIQKREGGEEREKETMG